MVQFRGHDRIKAEKTHMGTEFQNLVLELDLLEVSGFTTQGWDSTIAVGS